MAKVSARGATRLSTWEAFTPDDPELGVSRFLIVLRSDGAVLRRLANNQDTHKPAYPGDYRPSQGTFSIIASLASKPRSEWVSIVERYLERRFERFECVSS